MCLPHLPWIITFNDTVEWLGVFMDNGFACTEENATESVTVTKENSFGKGRVRGHRICPGRESARPHDVSDAPQPDLHLFSTRDAKATGPRPALASLESSWGSACRMRRPPYCASKKKRTRPRAPHDSSSTNQSAHRPIDPWTHQSKAKQGKARQSEAKRGKARQSEAKRGKARQSEAKRGKARQSEAKRGKARQSEAKRGKARQSEAKRGKARQSEAKQTKQPSNQASKQPTNQPIFSSLHFCPFTSFP